MGLLSCIINRLTGRRYWYTIEMEYRSQNGVQIATMNKMVGLFKRPDILNSRKMKQEMAPAFLKSLGEKHLCNGKVQYSVRAYLGWMKISQEKDQVALRETAIEDLFSFWLHSRALTAPKPK